MKDNTITELKHYIEQIHLKYPKILEQEKCQLAQAILPILTRHHSSESLNSLNSVFSQRSTQSAMQMTTTLHSTLNTNANPNEMNHFKKRGWLRSSFSRAFGRKNGAKNGSKTIDSNELNKSLENKKCLSDVEETDSISSQNQSMKNCAHLNESHRFDHLNDYGEFSLPNSPLHNPLVNNQ